MTKNQIIRKITLINKEIKYYKKVDPKNTEKIYQLLNERKHYLKYLKN